MKQIRLFLEVAVLLVFTMSAYAQPENVNADSLQMIAGYDTSGVRPCPFTAGDALKIIVYPDTTTFPNGIYLIDGDGYVDLPVIGYTKVTDKNIDELTDLLKQTYLPFMRYPHLTVRPLMRVSLFGGFTRPGLYYVDPHATIWEAIRYAGVTQRSDGIKKIAWERDRAIVQKDIVPFFQSKQSLYQIGFQSGDRMTVTIRSERTGWEVFRSEVLPMLTFSISTAVSVITLREIFTNR